MNGTEAFERSILLVEDAEDDVVLVQRAFRKSFRDVRIDVVRDGDAAVDYLAGDGAYADRAAHPLPALVLLDLKLPLRSGHEVLEWIRADRCVRRLPVVVLTNSRESADVHRAYDLGANSYLVKPVSPDATQRMAGALGLYWLQLNETPQLSRP